jgi:hypothetical protein
VASIRIIEPEAQAWEYSLSGLPYDFFHTSIYARAWQAEAASPVRLIAYRSGDSSVILPLAFQDIKGSFSAALTDAISPYGFPGPVMAAGPGIDKRRLIAEFIEALKSGLREIGCVSMFVRLQPLSPVNELLQNARAKLYVQGPAVFVDLTRPIQDVRATYRSNHRRDIKYLLKAGFKPFQKNTGWGNYFYEIYSQTMQRRNADSLYLFSRELFRRLEEVAVCNLRLVGCKRGDEVVCAALITRGAGIANYFLGGTRVEYLKQAPAKLMFDQAFEWEQAAGSERFILGGGVGAGTDALFNFKLGFSKLTCDSVSWREILDLPRYRALVNQTGTTVRDSGELSPFFPPYRCEPARGDERAQSDERKWVRPQPTASFV